ncbi:MAG: hypothetical protein L0312_03310, partial [Acidobacteria bacterium]|nr:hypothetical protein [Acidobacteriota bacterium]
MMQYYALLTIVTAVVLVLTWKIWSRTRSGSFLLGAAFLYYWTLFGAWTLVADLLDPSANRTEGFRYLEERLFTVALDSSYLATIAIYGLFLVACLATVLGFLKGTGGARQ